jgi:hypothetical protein
MWPCLVGPRSTSKQICQNSNPLTISARCSLLPSLRSPTLTLPRLEDPFPFPFPFIAMSREQPSSSGAGTGGVYNSPGTVSGSFTYFPVPFHLQQSNPASVATPPRPYVVPNPAYANTSVAPAGTAFTPLPQFHQVFVASSFFPFNFFFNCYWLWTVCKIRFFGGGCSEFDISVHILEVNLR